MVDGVLDGVLAKTGIRDGVRLGADPGADGVGQLEEPVSRLVDRVDVGGVEVGRVNVQQGTDRGEGVEG